MMVALYVLFSFLVEGSESLFELWIRFDQGTSSVDLLLDRDLENNQRFEVFTTLKRKQLSFDVIKVDFSSSIILLSFNHKFSAIMLDLFEVQSF